MSRQLLRYWCFQLVSFCSIPVLVFALPHLISQTPLNLYESWPVNLQQRAQLTSEYGFDRPLFTQGVLWFYRLGSGQWGQSRYYHRAVFDEMLKALKLTLALLLWVAFAYSMWSGLLILLRRLWVSLGLPWQCSRLIPWFQALPAFLLAIVLRNILLRQFGWVGPGQGLLLDPYYLLNPLYMLLPASILALPYALLGAARLPHHDQPQPQRRRYRLCRSLAHGVRHFHPHLGTFLMEVCLTEYIFSFPGLGSIGIEALKRRDLPILQGFILCTASLYFIVHVLCKIPGHTAYSPTVSLPGPALSPAPDVHRLAPPYRGVWCGLILLVLAIWGPQVAPYDPMEIHGRDQFLLPGYRYILGTDFLGRDVLSRTIKGFRSSIPRAMVLTVIVGSVSWLLVSLAAILPKPLRALWQGSYTLLLSTIPPFLLAFMAFLIAEQSPRALETALLVASLPIATQLLAWQIPWPSRLSQLMHIGGSILLLEVMFYFLNLSSESFMPTWGSDIRYSMQYGHMNIWMLLAPAGAMIWSRALFHQISQMYPAPPATWPCSLTRASQTSATEVR